MRGPLIRGMPQKVILGKRNSEGWGGAKLLSAPHTSISYTSILPRPAAAKLELAKLGR